MQVEDKEINGFLIDEFKKQSLADLELLQKKNM